MGEAIYKPFIFQTRQFFDGDGNQNAAKDSTLSFEDLDTTLLFLSSSIADVTSTINTGSLLLTASVNLNTITFTKGNGSTFPITVDTGSAVTVNTGSLLRTASVILNTITFTKGDGSTFPITVDTGSGQTYTAGNGILINGSNVVSARLGEGLTFNGALIDADVRTVNGTKPTNGNIPVNLTAVLTGPSASNSPNNLIGSSSGNVTGSITNATVWIVSGDTSNPDPDGLAYIFISQSATAGGAGEWLPLSYINQDTADLRYVRLKPGNASSLQSITSSFNISGSSITFSSSLFWSGASNLGGAANSVLILGDDGRIYKTGSYGTGGGGATPGGADKTIQFNDGGSALSGSSRFTFDKISNVVTLSGSLIVTGSTTFTGSLFWSGASDLGGAANNVLVLDANGQIYKTGSYQVGGGSTPTALTFGTQTANYRLVSTDNNKVVRINSSTNTEVYITASLFSSGDQVIVFQSGSGQVTFIPDSTTTILSANDMRKLRTQYSAATLTFSSSVCYLFGDIAP